MPDRALGSMMDHRCTAQSAAQSKAGEKHLDSETGIWTLLLVWLAVLFDLTAPTNE